MQIDTIFQIQALLGLPDFYQQANKSITLLGITQDIPKRVKMLFHIVEATSQWRRRWFTDSPSLLHKKHLSTMMICLFLRLSTIRILPKAAAYNAKKANKSITLLSITQDIPKREKMLFHRVGATSQWRRRWSTDSPSLLHKKHLFTMMICLFLRLSTIRIFPKVADHEKKAALEGAWVCHIPREASTFRASQGVEEGLDLE
jgi:hypothetical protein